MISTYICHVPSGASTDQFLHFGQEIDHAYFGRRQKGLSVPPDFQLHQISAPMSLHYSPVDTFTNPKDVNRLISKLNGSRDLYIQTVDQKPFNHLDFVWGIHANDLVYSEVLKFFKKHANS